MLLLEAGPDHSTVDAPAGARGANFFGAVFEPGPDLAGPRRDARRRSGRGAVRPGPRRGWFVVGERDGRDPRHRRRLAAMGRRARLHGWGWPEMLDAFLRVEDDVDYGGDGLHGKGGPIPLSRLAVRASCRRSTARCARRWPTSATRCATTTTRPTRPASAASRSRCATAGASRRTTPTSNRPARRANLDVRGDVLVDRVLFDGRRAIGVRTRRARRSPRGR